MIKIIVAHQTRLIGNIIGSVLSDESDIKVVGKTDSVDGVLQFLEHQQCDIILVSGLMPNNGALEITQEVAKIAPETKVLVIGIPESKQIILQYVMAGASGYVLQDVSVEGLLDNVRAIYGEQALISPTIAAALMTHLSELAQVSSKTSFDSSAYDELTPREREVLDKIAEGMTNQEIADCLFIEIGTVKNHVHNILKKLDVNSREEAATYVPFLQTTTVDCA